jgi:hypothetical protein
MKTKFIILFILFVSVFIGCKGDANTSDPLDLTKQVQQEEGFKVSLEVVVKKNDSFNLYFTEDGTIDFGKIQPISTKVIGNQSSQIVVFNIQNDVFPNEFRFDLGSNLEQDEIILKSIKFDFKGRSRKFIGSEIGMYFRSDGSNCIYDIATGSIKGKIVDGKRLTPLLYPHEEALRLQIDKMMK